LNKGWNNDKIRLGLLKDYRTEIKDMEVSKADWKLYRSRIGEWQEAYMEKLIKEYVQLLSMEENASDKFWMLEKRIKQDRKHPGVLIEMNKGNMIFDIVSLINLDVITMENLDGFSDDLKEQVAFILQRWRD